MDETNKILEEAFKIAYEKSMADFNMDETNKVPELPKTLIDIRAQDQARKRVAKIEVDITKIEAIYSKDFIFDIGARARVAKDFLGYRQALAQAVAECEGLARTLDGMISSSELQADIKKKKAVFQQKKADFDALLGMISLNTSIADFSKDEANKALEIAEETTFFLAKTRSNLRTVGLGMASMNTKSMADFNKDEAYKALEIARGNTKNGKYEAALKSAYEARLMNPKPPDVKRLVPLLQVLSAGPDITHYESLGVKETANEKEISLAYPKLFGDLHGDISIFLKPSEAFHRISEAMGVLSHDRSKYDNDLVVAREARAHARFADRRAATPTFYSAETRSNLHTVGLAMASIEDDVSEKKRRINCPIRQLDDFPELMHRIQSFLPAKEAARTSVLSKSWLHAWSTIPNIRFPFKFILPQIKYDLFMEGSLLRYENNNVPIETFDLGITISNQGVASLAENWIRHVSSKTCLKELSLNISVSIASFTLPAEIFLSERLKTVSIIADDVMFFGSLRISSNSLIKCVSLLALDLQSVSISDGVLHNLLNTCSQLQKLNISCCAGLKIVTVKSLHNLKELKIHSVDESPILEISDVPRLRKFRYLPMLFPMTKPLSFDIESLGSVTELYVGGIILDDEFFDIIRSKFRFLESLTLGIGHWAQKSLVITSGSLKRLTVRLWIDKQIDIEVYAPKLLLCICEGGKPVPRLSFPITPLKQFKATVI